MNSADTSTPWISRKWRLMGRIKRPEPQPISRARAAAALLRFQAAEFCFQVIDDSSGGRQKLRIALAAAPEGDVVAGIDGGIGKLGIRHGDYLRLE